MFELIAATPAQKRTVNNLCEKYRSKSVWVQYAEEQSDNSLRILLFAHRFIHDITITVDGYIKKHTSYDNGSGLAP